MPTPKLLTVSPDRLIANGFNTNILSPDNEAKLDESIRRNGLFKPIIVRELPDAKLLTLNQMFEVLGGEHRWESAKRVGLVEVPIVNLGIISDQKAKEIAVIDNARYGDDDMIAYAELLKSMGAASDLQEFLPYTDEDFSIMFSSADIALDDLAIDESFEKEAEREGETPEPAAARAPKTHTIMRFKVSLGDAARLTALIAKTQKNQSLTGSDELTNAGDALVFLLGAETEASNSAGELEVEDLLAEIVS